MAKATKAKKSIISDKAFEFFRNYINNASPVGFETWGQKLWLEYLKPYVDTQYVTGTYYHHPYWIQFLRLVDNE